MSNLIRYRNDVKICFIDFETLNLCLNFFHNLPWQLAMINVIGKDVVNIDNIFIKWDTNLKISDDAARITRYDQRVVDTQGITPEKAFDIMYRNFENCEYIIGHNILGFDVYLVYEFYRLFGKDPSKLIYKFVDTNALCKGLEANMPYNKGDNLLHYQYKVINTRVSGVKTNLKVMAKKYGIDFDENALHDGYYDLIVNKQVWDKIKFEIDI